MNVRRTESGVHMRLLIWGMALAATGCAVMKNQQNRLEARERARQEETLRAAAYAARSDVDMGLLVLNTHSEVLLSAEVISVDAGVTRKLLSAERIGARQSKMLDRIVKCKVDETIGLHLASMSLGVEHRLGVFEIPCKHGSVVAVEHRFDDALGRLTAVVVVVSQDEASKLIAAWP